MSARGQAVWVPREARDRILGGGGRREECFLSWFAQEDADSCPFALKYPHVCAAPTTQKSP